MTISRLQARAKVYEIFGEDNLGVASTAQARTATTLTDVGQLGTQVGTNHYNGHGLYIPTLVGTQQYKVIDTVAAGAYTIADDVWVAPFTELDYELLRPDVKPSELNDCWRRAMRVCYSPGYRAVSLWDGVTGTGDGNFEDSGIDQWFGGVGVTATIGKTTAITYNLTGSRSLLVTNSAANDYVVHGEDHPVSPGESFWLAALPILAQGTTVSFSIWDTTNPAAHVQIGQTITGTGTQAHHLGAQFTAPSGCYLINCRLGAAASNSIVAWDAMPGHSLTDKRFALPTGYNQRFKLRGFGTARYGYSPTTGVDVAASKTYGFWRRGKDFAFEGLTNESNPHAVKITRPGNLPACDLWMSGMRVESDFYTGEDDTSVSNAEEDMLMAAFAVNVGKMLNAKGDGGGHKWDETVGYYQSVYMSYLETTEPEPDRQEVRVTRVGAWGGGGSRRRW